MRALRQDAGLAGRAPASLIRDVRAEVQGRLENRRAEIEQAILMRFHAIAEPAPDPDPEYAEGLRQAVAAALDFGLAAIERGEKRAPPVPPALFAQARLAARNGVGLDTVMRRCCGGHTLFCDFVIEEAAQTELPHDILRTLLRAQATCFERMLSAVSEEHSRELESRVGSSEQHRAERVRRLLSGELLDTADLAYDFRLFHLGVIAIGREAAEAVRNLATELGCRSLLVHQDRETVWAWLGARHSLDPTAVLRHANAKWPERISLAIGEPAEGLSGWRLTHQQAKAAVPILGKSKPFVRYADVALLASIRQDEVLGVSLQQLYLNPLESERDGGASLRETLRAYFATDRNVSSAAAALGVSRQTVTTRIRVIEERLGRPLDSCATHLELALQLEDSCS